jgi:hypothetical protein
MTNALHTFMHYRDWFHICKDLTEGEITRIISYHTKLAQSNLFGSIELIFTFYGYRRLAGLPEKSWQGNTFSADSRDDFCRTYQIKWLKLDKLLTYMKPSSK